MGNSILAGVSLLVFGVLYWQNLWKKLQCWLLVLVGWGLGGLLGDWLQYLIGQANGLTAEWMQVLFGIGVPAAVAVVALLIFVLDMLPDSKVRTKPVGWHTRIAALLVPLSLASMPALGANLSAAIGV
ncbi:hypothetical protein [Stackebrandtia nassauensis]|uniref:Uncharacterized protein n=1 Tax=Stackebrandtia nassauensis (strain DSM 44728 / CIP 108903 / NRRL B-16338 / NBRC 102104 / LLR-40K-21) TaxID=446470 RepID=D3Q2X5_STANL|nr:hypothetical protein [Stackebrandtia nassauensis]ADD45876.1 hypothetical protein Snas_6256 [Stackebrandtia nassauensis DSM 44728]